MHMPKYRIPESRQATQNNTVAKDKSVHFSTTESALFCTGQQHSILMSQIPRACFDLGIIKYRHKILRDRFF